MKKNLIILTHGWTGSSVFSGLVERAGYWTGSETVKKVDYDTHENADLVAMNRRMMKELGYEGDYEHEFAPSVIEELADRGRRIDLAPYRQFVERCNRFQPWVWKDPRLTWTIRIWERALDATDLAFMILTREDTQAWISSNIRRHIQSMRFTREYNHGITASNLAYVRDRGFPHVQFSFEDVLLRPEETLQSLNWFLGMALSLSDLETVYRSPLRKKSRGAKDFLVALMIYLKNYSERTG
jgi:hypothetical protein